MTGMLITASGMLRLGALVSAARAAELSKATTNTEPAATPWNIPLSDEPSRLSCAPRFSPVCIATARVISEMIGTVINVSTTAVRIDASSPRYAKAAAMTIAPVLVNAIKPAESPELRPIATRKLPAKMPVSNSTPAISATKPTASVAPTRRRPHAPNTCGM
jgi:hypothetical protein